jgi:hypothetical protein
LLVKYSRIFLKREWDEARHLLTNYLRKIIPGWNAALHIHEELVFAAARSSFRQWVVGWVFFIFDDYDRQQGPKEDWPRVGIDAFLETAKEGYEELSRGRQIVIRKHR